MSTTRTSLSCRWPASQPVVTRGSKFCISLLENALLAGVGFGEFVGSVPVVFAQASFYHLVLQVVFEDLDPTPWTPVELPHEVVAAQGALQLLHGILGPYLVYPILEALPGSHGDLTTARRAPRDVRPGQLEEHVHVGQHVLVAPQ